MGAAATKGAAADQQILALLNKIAKAIGVDNYPFVSPILTGDGNEPIPDVAHHLTYVVKNLDALFGKWPMETQYYDADGQTRTLKLLDFAHAISELFVAQKVIAEDADASVNILARLGVDLTQTRIAALQGADIAKANAAFLGYAGKAESRDIKLQFTPAAAGINGKLENGEMADYLKPSTQKFITWSYQGKTDLLAMMMRTMESGEISRAALFRPISKDGSLTGDHLKKSKAKEKKKMEAEMTEFQGTLKKMGATAKVHKGVRKKGGKP